MTGQGAIEGGFQPASRLLLRKGGLLAADRLLLIGPRDEAGAAIGAAVGAGQVTVFDWLHRPDAAPCPRRIEGAWMSGDQGRFDLVILYMPKEKRLAAMLVHMAAGLLEAGGRLVIAGEDRQGVRSALRLMQEAGFEAAGKLAHGNHARAFSGIWPGGEASGATLQAWSGQFDGYGLKIASLPGVFSDGAEDDGTAFLLDRLDALDLAPPDDILDFACGAGVIAARMAGRFPDARLVAVDNSHLALEAARRTAALNAFGRIELCASNILSALPFSPQFDLIVSNPPFHEGTVVSLTVADRFFRDAGRLLRPGGRIVIVANSFLDYPPLMRAGLGNCEILADNRRFRVLQAVKAG